MELLKKLLKVVGILLATLVATLLLLGIAVTWSTQHGELAEKFLKGTVPKELPDGPYRGIVSGYAGNWRGKQFVASEHAGLNLFGDAKTLERKYPFTLYPGKGLRDNTLDVLKIDYNIGQNPSWLRMVLDEIVEVEPGRFLGKLHIRLIPGYPFALGYFELQK